MKLNRILLSTLLITNLFSCATLNSSSSILDESINQTNQSEITSENISGELVEVNVEIVYKLETGEIIDTIQEKKWSCEKISYQSPKIPFLTPDIELIEQTVPNFDVYHEVVYSYSDIGEMNLKADDYFDNIMFDQDKGISFTYILSNRKSKWDELIKGNNFCINVGRFKVFDDTYEARWKEYTGSMTYGVGREALLTSLNEEILVTFSIAPNGAISLYKNGVLHYAWGNRLYNAEIDGLNYNKIVQDFSFTLFEEIENNGFKIASDIKELKLDYAVSETRAQEIFESYVYTKIKYVDDNNFELLDRYVNINHGGYNYEVVSPTLPNYICDKEVVSGISIDDEEIVVKYSHLGEEKLLKEQVLDKTNIYEWGNTSTWINVASNLKNDFAISIKYHNEGIRSLDESAHYDSCRWRTALNIITDGSTNNFWITRLDWMGWFGGNRIGSNEIYSYDYFANLNDDVYNVYKDCYVYVNYIRNGNTLDIIGFIEPVHQKYKDKIYKYHYQLNNLTTDNISIYLTSEDAKVTLMSVKY